MKSLVYKIDNTPAPLMGLGKIGHATLVYKKSSKTQNFISSRNESNMPPKPLKRETEAKFGGAFVINSYEATPKTTYFQASSFNVSMLNNGIGKSEVKTADQPVGGVAQY